MEKLVEEKKIPSFNMAGDDGNTYSSEKLLGKQYVLFFYPRDLTPGCTQEACEFNDTLNKFEKLNTMVLGVSRDDEKSHLKFREKHQLGFPLLMDKDAKTANKFGIFKEKNMYGKKVMGVVRTTIFVDKNGVILKLWNKVSVEGHVEEVLAYAKSLKK